MPYPLNSEKDGVKIKPELMEKEKLYHCLFKEKIILVYKDTQEFLHCYEIEETDLVHKIKSMTDQDDIEKIFEDYLKRQDLNH